MGNDKNEEITRGLRRPRSRSENNGVADWEAADANLLRTLIAKASHRGGALRFGYTRDGGAYSVGVYYGTDYWTDYIRPGESIDDYLRDLIVSFEDTEPLPRAGKETKRKRP